MKTLKTVIADDSPVVRERFAEILSKITNVEVVGQTGNGKEALKLIFKQNPDVVVLDINMPGMNGIEILKKIKAFRPDIKVILFSSYSSPEMEKECLSRGADFFFQSNSIGSLIDLLGSMRQILQEI